MRKALIIGEDSVLWRAVAATLREAGIAVDHVGSAADMPSVAGGEEESVLFSDAAILDDESMASQRTASGHGTPPVILVMAEIGESAALQAMEAQVDGIVLLDSPGDALLHCFREVSAGRRWIDQRAMQAALDGALRAKDRATSGLTDRERQIADLCAEGRSTQQIADALGLALGTIKVHFHNIYKKLGVSGRNELTRLLIEERIK